jgi:hypothetical protein
MEQAEKPKELKVPYQWGGEREFDMAPLFRAATANSTPERVACLFDLIVPDLISYYINNGTPVYAEEAFIALRGFRDALLEGSGVDVLSSKKF